MPDPPSISADTAARALQEYFLANADRGDNAANDELVTEMLRRIRARRTSPRARSLMSTTIATEHSSDPAESTTPMARVDAAPHLSTQTVAWLADHPEARQFVSSVWNKLTELERSGQYPGAINALRRVLARHQPTSAGRCPTCRRWKWRRRRFPCIVWHQVRFDLLGLSAGGDRHRQPAGQGQRHG